MALIRSGYRGYRSTRPDTEEEESFHVGPRRGRELSTGDPSGERLWFGHAEQAKVRGPAGVGVADYAEAPLLVKLRHRQLEVQVPREHGADVGRLAGHAVGLLQEDGLLVLGDVPAVLVARRRIRVGAVAELGEPDLLTTVAVLDHDVAVLTRAGEGEEAVVGVVPA